MEWESKPPFIYMETDTGIVIFNINDSSETKDFYDKLKTEWDKAMGRQKG